MKWTLPVHGATSTLPLGLGAWSRMVIVADRGRVTCLALAAPVVDTVVLLSNLTASRGAGNLGQRGARAGRAVAEDPSESSHSSGYPVRIGWRACGRRGRHRFLRHRRAPQAPWES